MEEYVDKRNHEDFYNTTESKEYKFNHKITEDNFEMIDVGKCKYEKPVVIIYNPFAGKRNDKKQEIAKILD